MTPVASLRAARAPPAAKAPPVAREPPAARVPPAAMDAGLPVMQFSRRGRPPMAAKKAGMTPLVVVVGAGPPTKKICERGRS